MPPRPGAAGEAGAAAAALAAGQPVLLWDPAADTAQLVLAAEHATARRMAFLVRHTAGLVCVALDGETCDRLRLTAMTAHSTAHRGTAYCVAVDLHGTGTGISADARARTIAALADRATVADDLDRPGHVIPLRARPGGVAERAAPAEAVVDLTRLAGLRPAAALSELLATDGSGEPASADDAHRFARRHGLLLVSVDEVVDRMCGVAAAV